MTLMYEDVTMAVHSPAERTREDNAALLSIVVAISQSIKPAKGAVNKAESINVVLSSSRAP